MASVKKLVNLIRQIEFPVLKHEMRLRGRRHRLSVLMAAYFGTLSVLALAVVCLGWTIHCSPDLVRIGRVDPGQNGRALFEPMILLHFLVVCLVAPMRSAGAIACERRQSTLDMLSITKLSSSAVITQKLAASLIEIAVLLAASVPFLAIVLALRGVSPQDILMSYGALLVIGMLLSATGLFWSCFLNAGTAVWVGYACTIAYVFALPRMANVLRDVFVDFRLWLAILALISSCTLVIIGCIAKHRREVTEFCRGLGWTKLIASTGLVAYLVTRSVGFFTTVQYDHLSWYELCSRITMVCPFYLVMRVSDYDYALGHARNAFPAAMCLAGATIVLLQLLSIWKLDALRRS